MVDAKRGGELVARTRFPFCSIRVVRCHAIEVVREAWECHFMAVVLGFRVGQQTRQAT